MSKEKNKKWSLSPVQFRLLDSIDPSDQSYQTRRSEALRNSTKEQEEFDSRRGVRALVDELKVLNEGKTEDYRQGHLKPIVVWREPGANTGQYIIVSGFHRYAAYIQYNKTQPKKKRKRVIPAHLFLGTQEEAMVYSSGQDTKPMRSKSMEQKRNAAWALIRTGNTAAAAMTVRDLARETGVGKSLIQKMRSIQKQLEADPSINTFDSWHIQQIAMKGKLNPREIDEEENLIEKITNRAYRTLFMKDCKADRTRTLRVLRELAKRLDHQVESMDDLLGVPVIDDF